MFRAPGRRPPAVLSVAFALLALAPLGLLLAMLRSLGVNLRVRPRSRVLLEPSGRKLACALFGRRGCLLCGVGWACAGCTCALLYMPVMIPFVNCWKP